MSTPAVETYDPQIPTPTPPNEYGPTAVSLAEWAASPVQSMAPSGVLVSDYPTRPAATAFFRWFTTYSRNFNRIAQTSMATSRLTAEEMKAAAVHYAALICGTFIVAGQASDLPKQDQLALADGGSC